MTNRAHLTALAALFLLACSSDATRPNESAAHYELVSVNGGPLPNLLGGGLGYIEIGDLVLRADGTFGLGMVGYANGTYSVSGTTLTLSGGSGILSQGIIGGDSATVNLAGGSALHGVFRKVTTSAPIADALFTLGSINGRADLVAYDSISNGEHLVERILYDSLELRDAVFFRRHRAEHDSVLASPHVATSEYTAWGSYRGRPDSVELRFYLPAPFTGQPQPDRLALRGNELVRSTQYTFGPYEERYTRR